MYFLYNTLLALTSLLLTPIILYSLTKSKYRMGLAQKLGFIPQRTLLKLSGSRPVWIHAVSVGEVMAAIPLIQELKKRYPFQKILLSTVTATGNYTATLKLREVDAVIYFSFDYPFIVKRIINKIKPTLFITLETEIWPNFLRELKRNRIPSVVISGRISPKSYSKYRWARFFFSKVLNNIDAFCMQTLADSKRIIDIGAPPARVITAGNLKYDQEVPELSLEEKKSLYHLLRLKEEQPIFIAGSTHRGEEEFVVEVFKRLKQSYPDLVLILAPRHPERFSEVAQLLLRYQIVYTKKTEIGKECDGKNYEVILLDTIGELSKLYSIGTVIFVGGSLVPIGGHNVLEPVAYKKPVIFGPHMENFSEIARSLKESGGGFQVDSQEELFAHAYNLLSNKAEREKRGHLAFNVIAYNQGALKKVIEVIQQFIQ